MQRAGAKVRIHISKIIPQTYFPLFALMRIQAPHAFSRKLIPREFFPACIGFVPGGKFRVCLKDLPESFPKAGAIHNDWHMLLVDHIYQSPTQTLPN